MDKRKMMVLPGVLVRSGPSDTTAPTATLASSALDLVNGAITVTATLSEESTDFDDSSLTLVNCTAGVAGSGTSYTLTITPTADGTFTVQVAAGGFHDAAGNANADASNTISRIYLSTLNGWFRNDLSTKWQDTGRTVAATVDTDPVAVWDNLKSGGNNFVRSTGDTLRPTIQTANGVQVIRADGVNDRMDFTISADASQTVFVLAQKRTAPDAGRRHIFQWGAIGQVGVYSESGNNNFVMLNQAAANVNIGGTPANMNTISVVCTDTSSMSARINGGAAVTFDPYTAADSYDTRTWIQIGCSNGDYDYMELIQCTSALSDAARAAVEAYLDTRNPT
jgi:hypothetical protein